MILDFKDDARFHRHGEVTRITFEGTAVAKGIPELEEVHFALFRVDTDKGLLGYTWAVWNPLKRMWDDAHAGWLRSMKNAVEDLHYLYPTAQITYRLTFLAPDGKPTHPDLIDAVAEYEEMMTIEPETLRKISKESVTE